MQKEIGKNDNNPVNAGIPLILGGIPGFISGLITAILNNTNSVNGFVRSRDKYYDLLARNIVKMGNIGIPLTVAAAIIITAGVVLKIAKKPTVGKKTAVAIAISTAAVFLIANILLIIPYIRFQLL